MQVAVLNITTHPHSQETYIELFQRAKDLKIGGLSHSNRYAMITQFSAASPLRDIYTGTLSTFTDFDRNAPWLDTGSGEAATSSKVEAIRLPQDLKPDLKQIPFAFVPRSHRFVFELERIGVKAAYRAISAILNHPLVLGTLSEVVVSVVQAREPLDRIFEASNLRHLEILVNRPNPDDFGDSDDDVAERLERQHATRITVIMDGEREVGLKPDPGIRKLADAAITDGHVRAVVVKPSGGTEKISTDDHPLVGVTNYDPATTPKESAFMLAVKAVLSFLRGKP